MSDIKPMLVYEFCDAPIELQNLSVFGGDEDYLIISEDDEDNSYRADLVASRLAVCDYEKHYHNGKVVFITCHS